jgi:hypothetical protein
MRGWLARIGAAALMALTSAAFGRAMSAPAAAACPSPRAAVTIDVQAGDPVIDNSLPQPALQQIAGSAHHAGRTLGLYKAELKETWRVDLRQRRDASETCRWVHSVSLTLVLAERRIYVVRARRPGTCAYDAVLAHERKHQAVDDALIREFVPRLRRAIEAALPPGAAASEEALTQPISAAIQRELAAMSAARAARQAAVDTPHEYRRVRAACG